MVLLVGSLLLVQRRLAPTGADAAWLLSALLASAIPVYAFRYTPELTEAALVLAGLGLLAPRERGPGSSEPEAVSASALRFVLGGALLGLAAWHRPIPLVVLVLVPLVAARRRPETGRREPAGPVRGLGSGVAVLVLAILALGVDPVGLREWGSDRPVRVFTDALPAVDGSDFEAIGEPISGKSVRAPGERASLVAALWAFPDALVGRYSGVVWSYPALIVLSVLLFSTRSAARPWRFGFAGLYVGGLALLCIWWPHGYAGGEDAFGIRAAVGLFPLVVVAGLGLEDRRAPFAVWALAAVLLAQPLSDPVTALRKPALHAENHPYRWFPVDLSRAGTLPTSRPLPGQGEGAPRIQYLDGRAFHLTTGCGWVPADGDRLNGCLWTEGSREAGFLVWSERRTERVRVHVRTPAGARVRVELDGDDRTTEGEGPHTLTWDAGGGYPVRLDGRTWYLHHLEVQADEGFQPAFDGEGRSIRWLGAQINVGVDLAR